MLTRRIISATAKRWMLILLIVVAVVFASVAYMQFDKRGHGSGNDLLVQNDALLRNEIEEVEAGTFAENHKSADEKGKGINHHKHRSVPTLVGPRPELQTQPVKLDECTIPAGNLRKPTFDVSEMTYSLKTSDLDWDGDVGVWDAEMENKFQKSQKQESAKKRKLKVFLVPFSHSDPGWLMTVDQYLLTYTKNTLDLVLQRLQTWPDMTFIWAEVSFFELWWSTLNNTKKEEVRKLVASGRLEIVNGGYVMPDEASTHYYAILHQYVYGHQWLQQHLNITPRHGFSIDPFGYSSTLPYLLKNLGFQSIFIQRIHYILRKQLVHAQASQFSWQQPWDTHNSEAMFTYMSHATLYDIKHTCGQDPAVCIQFDYQYQTMVPTNTSMIAPAKQLLEQFRKTSLFYPHDVILFPIGMDFRWTSQAEWDAKYQNFRMIMDYLNGDPANDIDMKFGTYNDYYQAVFRQMGTPDKWKDLPSVTGDFFPYADRTVEYWTGYFTSHPFQKALNRDLENHLRTAEILFVLARMRKVEIDSESLLPTLELAAKNLGLYQHHDAITGTSKQAVSNDYEQRLYKGISDMYDAIQYTASTLLWPKDNAHEALVLLSTRSGAGALPSKKIILLKGQDAPRRLVVINSIASTRHLAVDVLVDTEHVVILDAQGKSVPYQVSLVLDPLKYQEEQLTNGIRVTFIVEFKSIGIKSYLIRSVDMKEAAANGQHLTTMADENTAGFSYDKPFVMENDFLKAAFSPSTGLLESITDSNGKIHQIRLEFKRYETTRSGAYLFWPYGIADMVPYPHGIRLLDGRLFTEIHVILPGILRHTVRLFKSPTDLGRSLHVENTHSLTAETNIEAVMRLNTDVKNNFTFYTDSNGFQAVRRRASHDLPMQANYFPATIMAFLQDATTRLTVHLGEAHGVGSQDIGQIEVMLDRRLAQDDARGVEEALNDPRTVRTTMRIQLETTGFCRDCHDHQPTNLANRINMDLNNPIHVLSAGLAKNETIQDGQSLAVLMEPLPCSTHLVMLKPVRYTYNGNDGRVGVVLHRMGTDCTGDRQSSGDDVCLDESTVNLPRFLSFTEFESYNETTLNFIDVLGTKKRDVPVKVEPMKIVAVTLTV